MARSRGTAGLVAALAAGLLLAACDDPVTELVVVVDTDFAIPTEVDSIDVAVTGSAAPQHFGGPIGSADALPLTLGLVPGVSRPATVTIVAMASLGGTEVVSRDVSTAFVADETRMVRILLLRSCAGTTCGAGTTCTETGCTATYVDPVTLPGWNGAPPPLVLRDGGADAGPSGMDAGPDVDAGAGNDAGPGRADAGVGVDAGTSCMIDADCSDVEHCNPATRLCFTPAAFGSICNSDLECASDVCVPGGALGTGSPGLCTQACCVETDCPAASSCLAFTGGLRICVPDTLGFPPPVAPLCTDRRYCAAPTPFCVLTTVSTATVETCSAVDTTLGSYGATCTADADCQWGACTTSPAPMGTPAHICTGPCGSGRDCTMRIPLNMTCAMRSFSGNWLPVCEYSSDLARTRDGEACVGDSNCYDGRCIRGSCSTMCCTDADCGATPAGRRCRPFDASGHWEMRCTSRAPAP